MEEKKNREGKGGKYLEKISPKIVKDIEKSGCGDFCQFMEGFGIGFKEFGLGKRSQFWFRKISLGKKSLAFGFRKFGLGKKVSVSVLENMVLKKVSVSVSVMVMMTMACVWCHQ